MKRLVVAFGLILGLTAVAHAAKSVSIDFTGDQPVAQGLKQVNNSAGSDGVTTIVKRGGKNVAQTGGTDAASNLYLQIDPAFKTDLKSVWVTVEYFDEGKDNFQLQYDGQDDPLTSERPDPRQKFDSQQFARQVWHLVGFKLAGGQAGGADLRINDGADGPEFIAKVTVSDEDPDFIHFPYAVNKITIDGKKDAAEWDGAYSVTLDRPQQDGVPGSPNWKGPEQFSGKYSFKWDENNFYILGEVRDATPRLNTVDDGVGYWNGDGTEQFLGLDDSDPERNSCVADKDFQIGLGLGKEVGWSIIAPGGETLNPVDNNIVVTDSTDGYLFEAQIPWARLAGNKVTAGQRIAWYMFANNSTVDPSTQEVALGPASRTGPSCNPSRWIRAMLDPKP
jgi:hypothetical protein